MMKCSRYRADEYRVLVRVTNGTNLDSKKKERKKNAYRQKVARNRNDGFAYTVLSKCYNSVYFEFF